MKVCPVCSSQFPDDVKFCPNDGATLRGAAPTTNLVGQVVADRYHIVKKLGEGGMGQVYLAEHVKMGRRSAIKVMNPSMVHDPDAVARFNREAANASRISHPNVCAIYDFGETPDGVIYLAMEFIEGEALTDVITRDGALPVQRAAHIFTQTADALQAAHDLGIVHRDLKPDNIMLSRGRDGRDVVKVVDFGIAKAVGGDEAGQKVTKTGLVVGTPEFMSPEQLSGDKVDGRSDLYALALVFFQMLTGKLPFHADTVQEAMIKRLTDVPATLATTRPDLSFPPGLQPTFETALARLPAERYQQVAKYAHDVATVTGSGRGAATAAIPATRVGADDRTQVLSASPTAVGAKAKSAAPARQRSKLPLIGATVAVLGVAGFGTMKVLGGNGAAAADSTAKPPLVSADTTGRSNPTNQRPTGTRQNGGTTPAGPNQTRRVDAARADVALDSLMEKFDAEALAATVIRDSALSIYNGDGVSEKDRGFAAYIASSAYARLDDRPEALRWARLAVQRDPSVRAYGQLVTSLSQP